MSISPFWRATFERAWRGAVAALVGAYLAGNLVFDTTNIGFTLNNVVSIAVGGAFSALALSLGINTLNGGSGPALTSAENLTHKKPAHVADERGLAGLVGLLVVVLLIALVLWVVF